MAEYIHVYHDVEERNRSTFHGHEDVRSLVHTVLEDSATVLIIRDGDNEKRFVLAPADRKEGA